MIARQAKPFGRASSPIKNNKQTDETIMILPKPVGE